MNSSFDNDLRQALNRVSPSANFAERVMAKIPERRPAHRLWIGAIAASLALLFAIGGVEQSRRERRLRAVQTHRQVLFALALAADKIDHVNTRLQKSGAGSRADEN